MNSQPPFDINCHLLSDIIAHDLIPKRIQTGDLQSNYNTSNKIMNN